MKNNNRIALNQTYEAIEAIRKCVEEILSIDDIKASKEADSELYYSRKLTIISWFYYLKREKQDSNEYEEAKNLILSIGNKHPMLAKWCDDLVNKQLSESEQHFSLLGVELNIDKTNELIIKDDVKIVVDASKAKRLIDNQWLIGTQEYNEMELEYKIIVDEKEYNCLWHIANYIPQCECPEDCPYEASIIAFKKNSDGERILEINVRQRINFNKTQWR